MAYAFAAAEIEDLTGLTTAVVYEDTSTTITWLDDRVNGASNLSTAASARQQQAMLRGTRAAEDAIRPFFRGYEVTKNQGLLFPAQGAIGNRAGGAPVYFDPDIVPVLYLEGVRWCIELEVQDKLYPTDDPDDRRIMSERVEGTAFTYSDLATGLAILHPRVWSLLSTAIPPPGMRWAA